MYGHTSQYTNLLVKLIAFLFSVKWKGIRVRKLPLLTTDIVYYIKGNCLEKIPAPFAAENVLVCC